MTKNEFLKFSWKQYLALEADFMQTERYISFEEDNMSTYSQEYIKQLQTICGEIDVQCKEYCKFLDNQLDDVCQTQTIWLTTIKTIDLYINYDSR